MSNYPFPLSLRATAFHEAGHAVACIYEHVPLLTVSIAPTKNSDGRVGHRNILHGCEIEGEDKPHHRLRMERLVRIALAGPAAERRFSPKGYRSYGGKGDLQFAFELVSKFVGTGEEHNAYFHLLKFGPGTFFIGRASGTKSQLSRRRYLRKRHSLRSELGALSVPLFTRGF